MNVKVKALLAIVAVSASSFALAQNKNFTGFSAGVNVNLTNVTADHSGALVGATAVKNSNAVSNASLQGQYGFGISDKFVVGLGVTGMSDLTAETGGTARTKLKNVYSINIEPGYVVSPATLIYAKVAYVGATAEVTAPGISGGTGNLSGTGIGFGSRSMLTSKLYLQAEYVYASFDRKNIITGVDVKVDTGTLSIGVGYNF